MDLLTREKRQIAVSVAKAFLGTPYIWGGDDPVQGFDCSGLVIECLKSVGILPPAGDWTADSLYQMFRDKPVEHGSDNEGMNTDIRPGNIKTGIQAGCLVFWFKPGKGAHHVEMCISPNLSIGASGGGSKTNIEADAIRQNAYVKIRPFRERKGAAIQRIVDPFAKAKGEK